MKTKQRPKTRFEQALRRAHRQGRMFVSEAARAFCVDRRVIGDAVRRDKLTAVREDRWLTVRRCEVMRYMTQLRCQKSKGIRRPRTRLSDGQNTARAARR